MKCPKCGSDNVFEIPVHHRVLNSHGCFDCENSFTPDLVKRIEDIQRYDEIKQKLDDAVADVIAKIENINKGNLNDKVLDIEVFANTLCNIYDGVRLEEVSRERREEHRMMARVMISMVAMGSGAEIQCAGVHEPEVVSKRIVVDFKI